LNVSSSTCILVPSYNLLIPPEQSWAPTTAIHMIIKMVLEYDGHGFTHLVRVTCLVLVDGISHIPLHLLSICTGVFAQPLWQMALSKFWTGVCLDLLIGVCKEFDGLVKDVQQTIVLLVVVGSSPWPRNLVDLQGFLIRPLQNELGGGVVIANVLSSIAIFFSI
jgi:hypothetical protein